MPKLYELIAAWPERAKSMRANFSETVGVFKNKANALFFGSTKKTTALDASRAEELNRHEEKIVETTVHNRLHYFFDLAIKEGDLQFQIDLGNCVAKGDIVLGGTTIAKDIPAVTLLAFEKKLQSWIEMVQEAPTLETGVKWLPDEQRGDNFWVRAVVDRTTKSENIPYGLVLAPATDKHPANAVKENKNVIIATVDETKYSGMIPSAAKARILSRLEELKIATIAARQRANEVEVPPAQFVGRAIEYIFS